MPLNGKVALVTGASRGVGRGIALQLGSAGATVYITGRAPAPSLEPPKEDLPSLQKTAEEINERGGKGIAVYIDHSDMDAVQELFKKIEAETNGVLDILVNNAFSASTALTDAVRKAFWENDPELWDTVNNVGLRNHYYCSVYGARLMVPRRKGLIINISSIGGLKYFNNVCYGVGKCALDRMAGDMSEELRKHNVAAISLWPSVVRTENLMAMLNSGQFDDIEGAKALKQMPMESPEYPGKAVVALASDENIMKQTGRIVITADAGIEYKFKDIDESQPLSIRSFKNLLTAGGFAKTASCIPPWLRLPGWIMTALQSRL